MTGRGLPGQTVPCPAMAHSLTRRASAGVHERNASLETLRSLSVRRHMRSGGRFGFRRLKARAVAGGARGLMRAKPCGHDPTRQGGTGRSWLVDGHPARLAACFVLGLLVLASCGGGPGFQTAQTRPPATSTAATARSSSGATPATIGVTGAQDAIAGGGGVYFGLTNADGENAKTYLGDNGASASSLTGTCTGTSPHTTINVSLPASSSDGEWTAVFHQDSPLVQVAHTVEAADALTITQNQDVTVARATTVAPPGTQLTATVRGTGGSDGDIQWTANPVALSVSAGGHGEGAVPAPWYAAYGLAPIPTTSPDAQTVNLGFTATCSTP